jgi:small-conductance mechanosensitive channel
MGLVNSLKRFLLVLALLACVTLSVAFVFDQLVAASTKLSVLFVQTIRTVLVVAFGSIIILFIRRSRSLLSSRIGVHPATVFQFFMVIVAVIVMIFAVLNIFEVPTTTLLVGGGVVSIVLGLVISTFVGNILAGTLVLMTNPYRVGDEVLVNNVPGKILEITAMTTRIMNYAGGQMVIPNAAIIQGAVIVTKMSGQQTVLQSRLPYSLGDRVYTTYMSAEGVVRELDPFYTKILLDSGRELTFLNNSVLTGSVAVARISSTLGEMLKFSLKIDWDPEKAVKAITDTAGSNPETFKSVPTVLYSSLDRELVELEVTCKIDQSKRSEAKSALIEAAYRSGLQKSSPCSSNNPT